MTQVIFFRVIIVFAILSAVVGTVINKFYYVPSESVAVYVRSDGNKYRVSEKDGYLSFGYDVYYTVSVFHVPWS